MATDLVLLPGLECDARLWRDVIIGLGDAVRPMVADLTQDDSITAMAARTLASAPVRFAMAGLSMGGYVALEIMRQAPERVSHLALLDTTARPDDEARKEVRRAGMDAVRQGKHLLIARAKLPGLLAPQNLDTALAEEIVAMAQRTGPESYLRQQTAIMARIDSRPFLAEITVPTLVGVGALDTLTSPELAQEMAAAMPGSRLVEFPAAGHMATMEAPEAVVAAMREWLAR
ncbi:alpha/beta fold hydrolase [Devosia sp. RR2S18]|uniref:alpha/beta fold hydrolase n=1 Tax=Devosia rhizosphaerae TaxID=3049774 RepID=UPI00253F9501|nr:alpha/beta fold hydrolase [Devosia sp. RR2S18]WIJ26025.1 alpha/beta fold hydrolase [Devosia sp. RR2S18]